MTMTGKTLSRLMKYTIVVCNKCTSNKYITNVHHVCIKYIIHMNLLLKPIIGTLPSLTPYIAEIHYLPIKSHTCLRWEICRFMKNDKE